MNLLCNTNKFCRLQHPPPPNIRCNVQYDLTTRESLSLSPETTFLILPISRRGSSCETFHFIDHHVNLLPGLAILLFQHGSGTCWQISNNAQSCQFTFFPFFQLNTILFLSQFIYRY